MLRQDREQAMALIGYARCSTSQQDTAAQIAALQAAGVDAARIFSEHVSGVAPLAERPQLVAAMAACEPGDVLILPKLDRLGRSMVEAVTRVSDLLDRGVHIRTLDGRIDTLPMGPMAKLIVGLLAAMAELERDLILTRTAEGRERAMAQGVKFGPKRKWSDAEALLVRSLRDEGRSYGEISRSTGKTVSTVRRILAVA
jgi:DNA invertase Pin-like site-specific DNA recombinase